MTFTNVGYPTKCARGAQLIACKGKPVFPCREDKSPHTRRGFKDATTNPGLVKAFWTKYPDALIGMPTGRASGLLVVDEDRIGAIDELGFELPETRTIATRRGRHYYFRYIEGLTNSPGGLPEGVDVRGEGGYVIVPPSEGYTVINRAPIADIPPELLELLRERRQRSECVRTKQGERVTVDLDSIEPIPAGGRNNSLASLAGVLRARGMDRDDLADALLEINRERCTPPLDEHEVLAIAASIGRYEPGKAGADAETTRYLDELERELWASAWPKIGGKSERSLVVVALKAARKHGRLVEGGVEVSIAQSQLALGAATSKRTVMRVLDRSEWMNRGASPQDGTSGTIVLTNPRARCHHPNHVSTIEPTVRGGDSLRAPFSSARLRWSAPGILRLGKSCEAVIDYLEHVGGSATVEELAEFMHISRSRDFRRRVIARLDDRDIITLDEETDSVTLVENWLEALNAERDASGEIEKYRLDVQKFNRESEAYRKRFKHKPTEHDRFGMGAYDVDNPPEPPPLSDLAQAMKAYLDLSPYDKHHGGSWLATTLWSKGLIAWRPSLEEAEYALEELSPERELRCRLAVARFEESLKAEARRAS